jgi:transcriptional regulator with XRE-family HTH domain
LISISAGQCRAARAFLGWTQRELESRSGVSKKSIADFERGASIPYPRTMEDLVETFEEAGIEFQAPQEGVAGPGLRLKWGIEEPQRLSGGGAEAQEGSQGGASAAWDNDIDVLDDATIPSADPEIEELRTYWRANSEKWAAMHKSTRWALLQEIGLREL